MATAYIASTIVVTGSGDNVIQGPVDIVGVRVADGGSTTVSKNGTTIMVLGPGTHPAQFRSAGGLTFNGACTILLSVSGHS